MKKKLNYYNSVTKITMDRHDMASNFIAASGLEIVQDSNLTKKQQIEALRKMTNFYYKLATFFEEKLYVLQDGDKGINRKD